MANVCESCLQIPEGMCYKIHGQNITKILCPNCILTSLLSNKTLVDANPTQTSEISGQIGVIHIVAPGRTISNYNLTSDEAYRFLGHALMPNEYEALLKHHSPDEFDLHDDFYTNDGFAINPLDDDDYIKNLKAYADTLPDDQKKKVTDNLFFMTQRR